ncbi:uncharacterized protein LOC111078396 isoform X3 [Drosophila obscura]|nr:uncharacterized protein LOC111078396 isoform X3 [Drosophila obscura]XP_041447995.1 uncharacterized protein LOC111078396 isoform X3 [Drosophila obscura]
MNTLWFLILIAMGPIAIRGHFEFDNIRCLVRDQKFMDFDYCYLRSVNRTYKYMSVKSKMHQLPITNAMIILQVRLRENKRILYNFNVRFDACKFLRERSNVLVNWVFQTFADYSNFNHTCPYYHDIILDKVPIQHINKIVEKVVPDGRFYLNSTWFIDGIPRCDLVIYFTKS